MNEQNLMKAAMNYGLYMGIALVLNSIIFYATGNPFSVFSGYLSYTIVIGVLVWGIWTLREYKGNKGLSYSSSLGFGTLISLFASLIVAFFTFVLYQIVDHALLGKYLTFLGDNMLKAGKPDSQMETMINFYKKFLTPLTFSIGQIFNLTFVGFFFSLIISFFYKRRPSNPHGFKQG